MATGYTTTIAQALLLLAVPFLIEMGAFALNDYYDVKADSINERLDRPLVTGEISEGEAFLLAVLAFIFGNAIALYLGQGPFLIAFSMTVLSWMYNARLKDLPLVGNLFIAATMAMPFIYAWAVAGNTNEVLNLLIASAFFMGLGREIVKDMEDAEGDVAARGSRTLPVVAGRGIAKAVALASLGVFYISSIMLLMKFLSNVLAVAGFIISLGLVSYALGFLIKDFKLDAVRKITLAAMGIGLLATFLALL